MQAEKSPEKKPEVSRKLRLQMIDGKHCLGSYVKDGEQLVTIGSSKTADLVIPGKKISGLHAMLRITNENDIVLYDLGSKSGTYLAGKRIVQGRVEPGTQFRVGSQNFQLDVLESGTQEGPEEKLFWEAQCKSSDILDVAVLQDGALEQIYQIESNGSLKAGCEENQIYVEGADKNQSFVFRKRVKGDSGMQNGAYCLLPAGYRAEVYDRNNQLLGEVSKENEYFVIGESQKARIIGNDREFQIYWRSAEQRVERGTPDPDARKLRESVGASLGLSLLVMAIMYFLPQTEKEVELAEMKKKSSYYRVTNRTEVVPAPAPAPSIETVDQVVQKEVQRRKKVVKKIIKKPVKVAKKQPSKTMLTSLSSLKNLVSKTNQKKVEVDPNARGRKVVQAAMVPVSSGAASGLKTEVSDQEVSEVNTGSLTASINQGRVKSLKGFKGGTGVGQVLGKGAPNMDIGLGDDDAETTGGLDKSVIARVVRAHLGQIKHCYERQLLVDPNLYGKVIAKWTIDANGLVNYSGIKRSTMGNKTVENCVAGKIKRWKFPKPKGGGKVIVSYPFLFKSVN